LKVSGLTLVIIFSAIGGVFKVLGGVVFESKSVFVDAMTSIANFVAAILVAMYTRKSIAPADADHPYGHDRYRYSSMVVTLIIYAFVLGLLTADIYESAGRPYKVSLYASLMAALGMMFYVGAIAISRRGGSAGQLYAEYTAGELIEGATTILSSLGGALLSYIIDFVGAVFLVSYFAFTTLKSSIELIELIADRIEPSRLNFIKQFFESRGLKVERIRVRKYTDELIHGDAVVCLPATMSLDEAHRVVDKVEEDLKKMRIDIVVHVEPCKKR